MVVQPFSIGCFSALARLVLWLGVSTCLFGATGAREGVDFTFDFETPSLDYRVLDATILSRDAASGAGTPPKGLVPIQGERSLLVDTLKSQHKWNKALVTREGLFRPGTLYVVTLEYQGGAQSGDEPSQFYCYLRSEKGGPEKDVAWQRRNLYQGEKGKLRFKVDTGEVPDYALHIGCYGKGSFQVDHLTIKPDGGPTVLPPSDLQPPPAGWMEPRITGADESKIRILPPRIDGAKVLSIRDFGGGPEKEDNFDAIQRALARGSNGPTVLTFPKGLYRVFLKPGGLRLFGATNFLLDGGGSELRFYSDTRIDQRSVRCYFDIQGSSRFEIQNFTFDWDWSKDPIASRAEVVGLHKEGAHLDLRFLDHAVFPRREILVEHLNPLDPVTSTVGFEGSSERDQYQLDAGGHTWLSDNTLRVAVKESHRGKFLPGPEIRAGMKYLVRHYKYRIHGLVMADNTHFRISNVNLFSTPGSGVILKGDTRDFAFQSFRITRRDGTRFISTASDHFNVQDSMGFFKIENCEFAFGGDDGINIHDNNSQGFSPREDRLVVLENVVSWRNKYRPGDLLEFRNADLSPTGFASTIAEVVGYSPESEARATLRLTHPVPDRVRTDSIIYNRRYDSQNYVIRDSYFHDNRARGILTHGPNVTIEGNRFVRTQGPALRLLCGNERRWGEGYGATNVLIRGNVFSNCNVSGQNEERPTIALDTYLAIGRTGYPIFQDIAIQGNLFFDPPGAPIFIGSARNVLVRSNEIRGVTERKSPLPSRGQMVLSHAQRCLFEANVWRRSPLLPNPGIRFDPEEVRDLFGRQNGMLSGEAP